MGDDLGVELTDELRDRVRGVLLGCAVGDALGVPYEFETLKLDGDPEMVGGGLGPYEPGEWSDDTQMAICIARVAAAGTRLTSQAAQDDIAQAFLDWHRDGATDIGVQTNKVLLDAERRDGSPATKLRAAAAYFAATSERAAGNGGLMRTAPVGLAFLHDRELTAQAARDIASFTHSDPMVGDVCVIWSEAIRLAVAEGRIDPYAGLDLLYEDSRSFYVDSLREAEQEGFRLEANSFTVTALQAAWHAVWSVRNLSGEEAIREGLFAAVRQGSDTDTTAAVAGSLLGAKHGASSIPREWADKVHGWPGMTGEDLTELGEQIAKKARPRF